MLRRAGAILVISARQCQTLRFIKLHSVFIELRGMFLLGEMLGAVLQMIMRESGCRARSKEPVSDRW
jgi:hypothetical protein